MKLKIDRWQIWVLVIGFILFAIMAVSDQSKHKHDKSADQLIREYVKIQK